MFISFFSHRLDIIVIAIAISRLLKRYLKVKRSRAPAYSRALLHIKWGLSKGGVKRISGPISRIPGGDRIAVKVHGCRSDEEGE